VGTGHEHDHGRDGHEHAGHEHAGHEHGGIRHARRRVLWWALLANAAVLVAEVVGGLVFASLALLADAAHLLTDVVALGVALLAQRLAERPATDRHSYGLQRAEVLGAQANALLLLVAVVGVVTEAVRRLDQPAPVGGAGLVIVAGLGLLVNLGSAVALHRVAGGSLNLHGAFVHMAADAAGSVAALVAGIGVLVWDANRLDPVASLVVSLLVVVAGWQLLRDTSQVLLEGTPRGLSPEQVAAAIVGSPGVAEVHHLHLWNLASDVPALSAHLVLDGEPSLHEAQARGDGVKVLLAERFGIDHATLEMECHPCADEPG
jgi:cobalt-zinc-cadmium efflux system protein